MKKVQLKLETLRVESFETSVPANERGTVDAHQIGTRVGGCTATTCPPNQCFCTENLSCRCN
ncbi:pinensin family lanthipeptide [Longimicrobium sp.]|uniref:pinensin family lanthipeptide n=1 Tax=Longimicrobium sp. TaxID=2029185 RepID=UPI003B3AAFB9